MSSKSFKIPPGKTAIVKNAGKSDIKIWKGYPLERHRTLKPQDSDRIPNGSDKSELTVLYEDSEGFSHEIVEDDEC